MYAGARTQYCGCQHRHLNNPTHATTCMYQVALKLYHMYLLAPSCNITNYLFLISGLPQYKSNKDLHGNWKKRNSAQLRKSL